MCNNRIVSTIHMNCSYLPTGVDTLSIEVYDECILTSDDLIAWSSFTIPAKYLVFNNDQPQNTFEEGIVLSGKQGEDKEGVLFMAFTLKVRFNKINRPKCNQFLSFEANHFEHNAC